jgi:hypothetical protein
MFRQPVLVFANDGAGLTTVHGRALARGVAMSVFTEELFTTGNDRDNRAVVRGVGRDKLRLVGVGLYGPKNAVDRVVKGSRRHP